MPAIITTDPPARRLTARRVNTTTNVSVVALCEIYRTGARTVRKLYGEFNAAIDAIKADIGEPPAELLQPAEGIKPCPFWGRIRTDELKCTINSLRFQRARKTGDENNFVLEYCEAGFPISDADKARIERLTALLAIAEAYDAKSEAAHVAHKHDELEAAAEQADSVNLKIADRIARTRSQTKEDLLAKIALYNTDPRMFGDETAGAQSLANSIIADAERLARRGSL